VKSQFHTRHIILETDNNRINKAIMITVLTAPFATTSNTRHQPLYKVKDYDLQQYEVAAVIN